MNRSITLRIDHIGVAVQAPAPPVDAYRRLGFSVTDPHELMGADAQGRPRPLGQQSAHFYFHDSYVELSAVTGAVAGNHLEARLARYQGLHILALRSDDIEGDIAALRAAGLSPSPAMAASRDVDFGRHDTISGTAHFRWSAIPPDDLPECFGCLVEHRTPRLVYQPAMTAHSNSAVDLTAIIVVSEDVSIASAHFAPFRQDGQPRRVIILTPEEAQRHLGARLDLAMLDGLLGFKVLIVDMAQCRDTLTRQGVAFEERDGRVIVAPQDAGGALLVFSERP